MRPDLVPRLVQAITAMGALVYVVVGAWTLLDPAGSLAQVGVAPTARAAAVVFVSGRSDRTGVRDA